jgi:hypothetical protein
LRRHERARANFNPGALYFGVLGARRSAGALEGTLLRLVRWAPYDNPLGRLTMHGIIYLVGLVVVVLFVLSVLGIA